MVATTPASKPYVPWYQRWDLPAVVPGALLALIMVWSVVQSIAVAEWTDGLAVLASVALPALLLGIIFARLPWLPGWLAHLLSAALGVAWSIHRIGPLLVRETAQELAAPLGDRLVTWSDRATEVLIRAIIWARILQAGGRGEDIVLFVVAVALLSWALGYVTGWLLFRTGWTWWAVLLNAIMILVNYTYAWPKPNSLFFLFLGAALLLVVHQNVVQKQRLWRSAMIEYPDLLPWRFMLAAALFCGLVMLVTSVLPGNVSSARVAQIWRTISTPFTAMREGWEDAFSTIKAPPGTVGNSFATGNVRVGGPRALGDAIVMRVRSSEYDYWRAVTFDKYTGHGWLPTIGERARAAKNVATTVQARTPVEPGVTIPHLATRGRTVVTTTIDLTQGRGDDLIIYGGELLSAELPILIQHGFVANDAGQVLPNFDETAAVYSQLPLSEPRTYTITTLISTADEQSLREAGTDYPAWVRDHYLDLPATVTERTRAKAREIVTQAGATNPYDQALAIQRYLSRLTYDEARPAPPENRDWVDYFLFDSQRGYCDDFATAMVVLLRSLNIPARWVQGYAGGTLDAESGMYIVRQSVAHSWPEVYFPGFGWQRFEPTPASYASPPARPATPSDSEATDRTPDLGTLPSGGDEYMRDLLELERLMNSSQGDLEASRRALEERLRAERLRRLAIGGGVIAVLLVGVALFFVSLRREIKGLPPAAAVYARLGRLAAWAGLPQRPHVTPYEYAGELGRTLPAHQESVDRLVKAYVAERYSPEQHDGVEDLEAHWRAVRRPLLVRLVTNMGAAARTRTAPNRRRRHPNGRHR